MSSDNILRAKNNFSLVIFGASGHLAQLKIFPALYFMALKGRLTQSYAIVGYARTEMDDEGFRAHVSDAIHRNVPAVNDGILNDLLMHVHYQTGQYDDIEGYKLLSKKLEDLEDSSIEETVRVAYLSVPPSMFGFVMEYLCKGGVHRRPEKSEEGTFRCIVEKPLGSNAKSAQDIRSQLSQCFQPDEIYLLDHYLGKEAARNIYYLRLINPIVERILKNTLVTNVQITASETAGLEGRAGYFEAVGTLRDMFQSHMTSLTALLTMHLVERSQLKVARLEALKNIYVPPASDLSEIILQGQYTDGNDHHGYRSEEGVSANSRTPTYVVLKLMSRVPRWQGVPFYLRSGKCLASKETKIAFEYQNPYAATYGVQPNRLEIILQGEAGMRVRLQTKKGGSEPEFRPLILEDPLVCVGDCMDEHGLLLLEAINGKQDWFLDFEEVMASWKIIDPLQAYLDRSETPLFFYPCSSNGPKEVDEWIAREGHTWI